MLYTQAQQFEPLLPQKRLEEVFVLIQMQLSRLHKTGLVESDTPLGAMRFGLPPDALQLYFLDLHPEAVTRAEEE